MKTEEIEEINAHISDALEQWHSVMHKAKRRYYNRIFGLTRLKNQAITLKYLLKDL